VVVCGENNRFEGIRLMIQWEDALINMTHIGSQKNCTEWVLQGKSFFERLTLGYDAHGPTYLSIKANTG